MSGHSKWATTKHQKARADKKRAKQFSKASKLIMVAARDGADPEMNFKLRLAIDKAKAVNMPKDNIERAVKKGAGLLEGEQYWDITYEAYAPGGVALVIEVTTDNKNRTVSNVRAILNKLGGSLGSSNSVLYMFEQKGVIEFELPEDIDKDEIILELIDQGAQDVKSKENKMIVYTSVEKFLDMKDYIEKKDWSIEVGELQMIADTKIDIDEKTKERVENIIEALEDNDDVNQVYTNAKL